jgi:hypothetical protein
MLTDIFSNRYSATKLWDAYGEPERRLLVQAYRILSEQICRYYDADGKESNRGKAFWTDVHSRLSMELGLKSLSPLVYSYPSTWNGKPHTVTGTWTINTVCENWMLKASDDPVSADRFIKERLSLVEIGFRRRGAEIAAANANLPAAIENAQKPVLGRSTLRLPGDLASGLRAQNATVNALFQNAVTELNTRFRQAGCDLNYHNGFIQRAADALSVQQVETPYWALVGDPKWKNVDTDMKEALDRRDTSARDPAFYAARALESTIKIVSDEKGWTHGKEKGAHNYIDNLASKRAAFLADWESDGLKKFFTKVRNPLGHGPGNEPMPILTQQQTDWAIETCMIWIKSIIRRL